MALDRLWKDQQRLCELLSNDPDYILGVCGNLLYVNEYKQIEKQSCALDKMKLLLKAVMLKGEETCQIFDAILRKHGGHYQQWLRPAPGSPAPTALADNSSVIMAREITDTRGKSLSMKTDMVSKAESPSGIFTGLVPQHNYIATGRSYISFDKLSCVTVDGDIDLSVTMTSQRHSGGAEDTQPSSQEPAVKRLRENKQALVDCLRSDCTFILQLVDSGLIVTDRQYQKLKEVPHSENAVIDLIDLLIANGQESCSRFLNLLKKPEVLETYPKLRTLELGND